MIPFLAVIGKTTLLTNEEFNVLLIKGILFILAVAF